MKNLLVCLIVMVCLLGLANITYGSSGKAEIPFYATSSNGAMYTLFVSNITSDIISVKVTLYKTDGTLLTDNDNSITTGCITGDNLSNYSDNSTDYSASFTIAANNTGYIRLTTLSNYGYGIIEWTQNSKVTRGLLAYADYKFNTGYFSIPINNGTSF